MDCTDCLLRVTEPLARNPIEDFLLTEALSDLTDLAPLVLAVIGCY